MDIIFRHFFFPLFFLCNWLLHRWNGFYTWSQSKISLLGPLTIGSNIDIHQQLWPLTASYLAMFKVTSIYRLLQTSTDFYRLLQTSTDFYRQRQSAYLYLAHLLGPIFGLVLMRLYVYLHRYTQTRGRGVDRVDIDPLLFNYPIIIWSFGNAESRNYFACRHVLKCNLVHTLISGDISQILRPYSLYVASNFCWSML